MFLRVNTANSLGNAKNEYNVQMVVAPFDVLRSIWRIFKQVNWVICVCYANYLYKFHVFDQLYQKSHLLQNEMYI